MKKRERACERGRETDKLRQRGRERERVGQRDRETGTQRERHTRINRDRQTKSYTITPFLILSTTTTDNSVPHTPTHTNHDTLHT